MRRLSWMLILLPALLSSQDPAMPSPKFTPNGRLIRPEGYREWMFVGANLGMGYTEGPAPAQQNYHNIYIQREAYKAYRATGKFPDKTMLVMEVLSMGTKASINRNGSFEDQKIGIEVALKDEKRYPEKWAYFNFIGENNQPKPDSAPFKKEQCWNCHNQHAAKDNVFLQFYPALRDKN